MNARSLGELLVSNEEFRKFFKGSQTTRGRTVLEIPNFNASPRVWSDGPARIDRAGTCSPSVITDAGLMDYAQGDPPLTRATLTTAGLTSYDRPPGVVLLEQQQPTIADLLLSGTTNAPTVRYTKENSYTNAADAVAEEGQKPEATFDLVESDVPVRKIAVFGKVTDETFADFPQIQNYIDQRMRFMVAEREDARILSGSGVAPQITGILNTSGIQTISAGAYPNVIDAIGQAMGRIRENGHFEPTFTVLNARDYTNLSLTKNANGDYYFGGPGSDGPFGPHGLTILLGKPCLWTTAIARGTALVGARLGAQVFRRQGITLEISNSHDTDFQYNRLALRCEERLALAVWRPLAFCSVTGIPLI